MILENITDILSKDYASFEEFLDANRTYGISFAVVKNRKITETLAIGLRQNITPFTMFQSGSLSKSIFAATLMRLHEKKVLNVNKDLSPYLMGFDYPTYDKKPHIITLSQILSHTAGFNVHGFSGYEFDQNIPKIEQILRGYDHLTL